MESCNEKDYFNNQHRCKSFLICVYFFPEAVVKLLISTKSLGEEKEAMEKILSQTVQNYVKFNDLSRDDRGQALKSFTELIIATYKLNLVSVGEDSVVEGNPDKVAESK